MALGHRFFEIAEDADLASFLWDTKFTELAVQDIMVIGVNFIKKFERKNRL